MILEWGQRFCFLPLHIPFVSIWEWNALWHRAGLLKPPLPKTLCSGHLVVRVCCVEMDINDLCPWKGHPGSTTLMGEYAQLSSKGPEALASHQPCSVAGYLWSQYPQGPWWGGDRSLLGFVFPQSIVLTAMNRDLVEVRGKVLGST